LDELSEQNYISRFDAELYAIDDLIAKAAAATDEADYYGALELFKQAVVLLKSARENICTEDTLLHAEETIAEIGILLGAQSEEA